jgi:hypothetical protein
VPLIMTRTPTRNMLTGMGLEPGGGVLDEPIPWVVAPGHEAEYLRTKEMYPNLTSDLPSAKPFDWWGLSPVAMVGIAVATIAGYAYASRKKR